MWSRKSVEVDQDSQFSGFPEELGDFGPQIRIQRVEISYKLDSEGYRVEVGRQEVD